MIPQVIKHADLIEALAPLLELLQVDAKNVYSKPPITISSERVEFVVHEVPEGTQAEASPLIVGHKLDDAEQGYRVVVLTELGLI